ncbi:hypothetical protein [Thermasporomyces composti]|uniref:Uncharacterized protein n=1 Tax=Thermasporomyces composti TaxID=696763 RepID=A0A3D9VBU4_THECX|nr:hypothetical protein [Thermasporomyces composti]REF35634.1 hypothetical protein DFJ64_1017 [Thermasporomyces composti]
MLSLIGLVRATVSPAASAAVSSGAVVASPRNSDDWVGPGLLGFVVLAVLGVATVLLWRSMNKQLRKVTFEERPDERTDGPDRPADHRAERGDAEPGDAARGDGGSGAGGSDGPRRGDRPGDGRPGEPGRGGGGPNGR